MSGANGCGVTGGPAADDRYVIDGVCQEKTPFLRAQINAMPTFSLKDAPQQAFASDVELGEGLHVGFNPCKPCRRAGDDIDGVVEPV